MADAVGTARVDRIGQRPIGLGAARQQEREELQPVSALVEVEIGDQYGFVVARRLNQDAAVRVYIHKLRRKFVFVSKTQLTDDVVFNTNKFIFGVDGRCNVGVGMWQTAFMSKAELTVENYAAARAAMSSIRRKNGSTISITPKLLVVPPALEGLARAIVGNDMIATTVGGTTVATSNPWKGTAEVLVVPLLG